MRCSHRFHETSCGLLSTSVRDRPVRVFHTLDIVLLDEGFQPVANGSPTGVVGVLELDDKVSDDVAAAGHHLLQYLLGVWWVARSRHTLVWLLRHLIVAHAAKNYFVERDSKNDWRQ